MDRVGLLVELIGNEKAMSSLRDFKTLADQLNSNRIQLKIDTTGVDRELARTKRDIADLRNERNNILRMKGDTSEVDKKLSDLIEKKNQLTYEKDIMRIEAQVDTQALSLANDIIKDMEASFRNTMNTASEFFGMLSTASNFAADFANGISDAFGSMASLFNSDLLTTIGRTLTYTATRQVTGSIGSIISRYDIMSTFTDYMELAGVSAEQAAESLNKVDLSIRGIPIGLDEAAFRLRRYQMYLGDIDRATNLTIGLQRALIAGGSSEQMQTTAYTQIDRLLATGKLGQSRQWISLFNGLGVSLKFLKEELALDPTARMQDIASDLAAGRIEADEFLKALERLASNEGLSSAIDIYKSTVSAWLSNIKNAVKRGGQGVMDAFNDVLNDTFGTGITGLLKGVRDEIDETAKAMSRFIRENPQIIESAGSIIGQFRERVGGIDFGSMIQKISDNLGRLFEIIFRVMDRMPKGFFEDFTAFAVTLAGPLSKAFKAIQGGLPIVLGIFDRFRDFDFADLIDKIVTQVERLAKVISNILGLIPDGLMGDLMAFGLVWGRPLAKVFGLISGALGDIARVGNNMGGANTFLGGLITFAVKHPLVSSLAGAISAVAIGVSVLIDKVMEARRYQIDEFLDRVLGSGRGSLERDIESSIEGNNRSQTTWEKEIAAIDTNTEKIRSAWQEVLNLDNALGNTTSLVERKRLTDELNTALAEFNELSGLDIGELDEDVKGLAGSYAELTQQQQLLSRLQQNRSELKTTIQDQELNRDLLVDLQERRRNAINELDRQIPGGLQNVVNMLWEGNEDNRTLADAVGMLGAYFTNIPFQGVPLESLRALTDEDFNKIGVNQERMKEIFTEYANGEQQLEALNEEIRENYALYEEYGNRMGEVKAQIEALSLIDFSPLGTEVAFTQLDEGLQKTIASFKAFQEEALEAIGNVIAGFADMSEASYATAEDITNALASQEQYLADFNTNFESILRFAADNPDLDLSGILSKLTEKGPEEGAAYAAAIVEGMKSYQAGDTSLLEGWITSANAVEAGKQLASDLFAGVQQAATDETFLAQLRENAEWFGDGGLAAAVFGDVQTAVDEAEQAINDVDFSGYMDTVEEMQGEWQAFMADITGAPAKAETAAAGLNSAMNTITFQAAIDEANRLRRAIEAIPNVKTITVNYGGGGPITGWRPDYYASGGEIYAKGTDTIPAMLSPGEFVLRKSAVDLFGRTTIEKINGMDVGGAFDAMWSRLGAVANGTVNNYYNDNHAVVNINNYGNTGQTYSQKQAFKWASAL